MTLPYGWGISAFVEIAQKILFFYGFYLKFAELSCIMVG